MGVQSVRQSVGPSPVGGVGGVPPPDDIVVELTVFPPD